MEIKGSLFFVSVSDGGNKAACFNTALKIYCCSAGGNLNLHTPSMCCVLAASDPGPPTAAYASEKQFPLPNDFWVIAQNFITEFNRGISIKTQEVCWIV